ncbi:carbohydrate sulfotransferase 4-like [Pseudophryne corroboree]|uniref:carbohydrate sulfotransferase 4-like n=1 Tax=Pseudophryne corroboree TaxID=495146 RepID=UPI003081C9DA
MALRVRYHCLIVVSLLIFFSIWTFNHQWDSPKEKRIHIIILSSWRSGSSFLGQIFNHNPNVFYIYEPARMVWVKLPNEKPSFLHYPIRDLLRSLFTCDMSPLHHYLPRRGRYISDLPFWWESRALCSPPACSAIDRDEEYDRPTCFQQCGYFPLDNMAHACEVHSHVVLKTVRVLDLGVLLPLLQDSKLDLRIIHLVRDPRAVAFSRMNFGFLNQEDLQIVRENKKWKNKKQMPNITHVMDSICNAQVAIDEFRSKAGKSLRGQYMMIRYEDLAKEPLPIIEQIFNFASLRLTEGFQGWLYNITHQSRQKQGAFMNFALDSMKIIQKWRIGLNHNTVLKIQNKCRNAMEIFGYGHVESLKEQHDLNSDVLTEVKKNQ